MTNITFLGLANDQTGQPTATIWRVFDGWHTTTLVWPDRDLPNLVTQDGLPSLFQSKGQTNVQCLPNPAQ